jgi:release factor glutamine methyltransferase
MPQLLADISNRLACLSATPALDASVLLAHILEKPRTWVLAHPELDLSQSQQRHLTDSLARLESGEPFPYVLGRWEFFGMEFDLTPDVLIPRPETELLVEKAIAWLQGSPARRAVADVGTGSGVIAVSIAVQVPDVKILATDISPEALLVAKRNAQKFAVEKNIAFIECDLLPAKPEPFTTEDQIDLLCANLPYIPTATLHSLPIYGREPTRALDGGEDGLGHLRHLMMLAPDWLASNAMMLLEIEATQGTSASNLAGDRFPGAQIHVHQDLSGRDRLLEIVFSA